MESRENTLEVLTSLFTLPGGGFNLFSFSHQRKGVIFTTRINSDLARVSMKRDLSESSLWITESYWLILTIYMLQVPFTKSSIPIRTRLSLQGYRGPRKSFKLTSELSFQRTVAILHFYSIHCRRDLGRIRIKVIF